MRPNVDLPRTIGRPCAFREYLYRDQIVMVDSDTLRIELSQLEYLADKNKIDHPPRGSKDVADAVCGAIFSAVRSRSQGKDVGYHEESGQRHRTRGHGERQRPNRQRPQDRPRPQGDRQTINNRVSGSYYSSGYID